MTTYVRLLDGWLCLFLIINKVLIVKLSEVFGEVKSKCFFCVNVLNLCFFIFYLFSFIFYKYYFYFLFF
ncbi:MAG: hypothetical protein ACI9Y1_001901 [Lentisphaeria bacterium]|jgi:hypothetical protein